MPDLYSIAITTYECYGDGVRFTLENLQSIISQTYRPIEVIISDHSKDNLIENAINKLDRQGIEIVYVKYCEKYGNAAANFNNSLKYVSGKFIQCLSMDERLSNINSIQTNVDFIKNSNSEWIMCAALLDPPSRGNIFIPRWNPDLLYGINTMGGPGCVIFKDSLKSIQFDENLKMMFDDDWYYRIFLKVGVPKFLNTPTYIDRQHSNQLSQNRNIIEFSKTEEPIYLETKYGSPLPKC